MIEPEVAFADLEDNMNLAEDMLNSVIRYVLENCREDLEFLDKRLAEEEKIKTTNERSEMGLLDKLEFVINNRFERLTYTEAIDILRNSTQTTKKSSSSSLKVGGRSAVGTWAVSGREAF